MTEETKTCDCKEKCIKKLKEWAFIASAVFVGALLAILLGANILRPKCPPTCPMMHPEGRGEHQFRGPQGGLPTQFREHRGQKDLGRRFKHHKDLNLDVKPVHEQAK